MVKLHSLTTIVVIATSAMLVNDSKVRYCSLRVVPLHHLVIKGIPGAKLLQSEIMVETAAVVDKKSNESFVIRLDDVSAVQVQTHYRRPRLNLLSVHYYLKYQRQLRKIVASIVEIL